MTATAVEAPRVVAVVLSDGDEAAAAASVDACRALDVPCWIAERSPIPTGVRAPVLVADWQTDDGATAIVDAAAGLADWVLVLAAGERVVVDHPGGLRGVVGSLPAGPVVVRVTDGAEVRLHPPTGGLVGALGTDVGFESAELRIVAAASGDGPRLHLGCGPNRLEGWTNVDVEAAYAPDIVHDLSSGLPADDGTVALIYSEHFWEHLHIDDGVKLMADCYRALRAGGVLRIAMPDLEECVRRYLGDWRGEAWVQQPAYDWVDTPARMLNASFREWDHRYLYDAQDVIHRLRGVGFDDVRRVPWGESEVPALRGLETRPESLLVVEARR